MITRTPLDHISDVTNLSFKAIVIYCTLVRGTEILKRGLPRISVMEAVSAAPEMSKLIGIKANTLFAIKC